jgi:protein involved in polysaccharide export with SLBB domain
MTRACAALLMTIVLVAFAWPQAIRPGDKIRLTVKEEPQLNRDYAVNDDGVVLIDFLGAVKVAGLTPDQAAEKIAGQLEKDRILRVATVRAEVINQAALRSEPESKPDARRNQPLPSQRPQPSSQVVLADGEGVTAAAVEHVAGMRLSALLSRLDLKPDADLTSVRLVSEGRVRIVDTTRSDNLESDPELEPGDRVTVGLRTPVPEVKVTVLGGVAAPGEVVLRGDTTLGAAIDAAGGPRGSLVHDGVILQRPDRTELKIDPLGPGLATQLVTGDIVTVEVAAPRLYVSVEGAVRQPGFFVVEDGLTLTEAVRLAGGLCRGAQPGRIQVVPSEAGAKPKTVNLQEIEHGYRGDVALRAGDRVIVPGSSGRNARVWIYAAGAVVAWSVFVR